MWKYGGWVEANKRNILAGTLRWQLYQNSQYSAPSKWPILKRDSQFSQSRVKFKQLDRTSRRMKILAGVIFHHHSFWGSTHLSFGRERFCVSLSVSAMRIGIPGVEEAGECVSFHQPWQWPRFLATPHFSAKSSCSSSFLWGILSQILVNIKLDCFSRKWYRMKSSPLNFLSVTANPCSQTLYHQKNAETEIHANCLFSFSW